MLEHNTTSHEYADGDEINIAISSIDHAQYQTRAQFQASEFVNTTPLLRTGLNYTLLCQDDLLSHLLFLLFGLVPRGKSQKF